MWRLRAFPFTWGVRFLRVSVPLEKDNSQNHFLVRWCEAREDGSFCGFDGKEDPIRAMEFFQLNPAWKKKNSNEVAFLPRRERRNVRFRTPHSEKEEGSAFYLFILLEKYFHELTAHAKETGRIEHPTLKIFGFFPMQNHGAERRERFVRVRSSSGRSICPLLVLI